MKKLGYSPAEIYDAEEKQAAREELYGILKSENTGSLLILPGPRPHETNTALRHGFTLVPLTRLEEIWNMVKTNEDPIAALLVKL